MNYPICLQSLRLCRWLPLLYTAVALADNPILPFDIPSGTAERTLHQFALQSGVEVLFATDAVAGVRTNAVKGRFVPTEALGQMLRGTPLYVVDDDSNPVLRIARAPGPNVQRAVGTKAFHRPAALKRPTPFTTPRKT